MKGQGRFPFRQSRTLQDCQSFYGLAEIRVIGIKKKYVNRRSGVPSSGSFYFKWLSVPSSRFGMQLFHLHVLNAAELIVLLIKDISTQKYPRLGFFFNLRTDGSILPNRHKKLLVFS